MSSFADDNTSLPYPKSDLTPLPSGADSTKYVSADDWNAVCQAAIDLRTHILDASKTALPSTVVTTSRSITTGTGLSGGGTLAADRTISLANTDVTAASYTNTSLTVDAQGRITAASSGVAPASAARVLTAGTGLTGGGNLSADRTFAVAAHGVTYALQAQAAASTLVGNNTAGTADKIDLTTAQVLAMLAIKVGGLGDGSDGAAVFDGTSAVTGYSLSGSTYTAQREMAFTNATFSSGVVVDQTNGGVHTGFRLFIAGTATITSGTATIKFNGNDASGVTGGAALGTNPQGNTSASGAGAIQNAGQAGSNAANWTNKIKGGTGGNGGASATNVLGTGGIAGNTYTALQGEINTWNQAMLGRINLSNPGIISGGAGGASGGGTTGIAAGGAGGGGAGVGVVGIGSVTGAGTLVIEARGGAGSGGASAVGSNAGGGGGGGGGVLFVGYGGSSQPVNLTTQCPGGTGGAPQGTGVAGSVGGTGTIRFYPLGAV